MATFIVGDIHGNATALGTLLVSIENELSREDAGDGRYLARQS